MLEWRRGGILNEDSRIGRSNINQISLPVELSWFDNLSLFVMAGAVAVIYILIKIPGPEIARNLYNADILTG